MTCDSACFQVRTVAVDGRSFVGKYNRNSPQSKVVSILRSLWMYEIL
jgi:hypothetical protein